MLNEPLANDLSVLNILNDTYTGNHSIAVLLVSKILNVNYN